jgi:serine/threonine-protein kinase
VYAAGVILYELLTGRVPFSGATPLNVLTAHLTEAPMAPRTRAPERSISPALEAVALHAITKDPGERYATAGALAMAIRSALASPEDAERVRPAARVNVAVDTTDAHSATLPAPMPYQPALPAPRSVAPRSAPPPTLPSPSGTEGTSPVWIVICVVAALAGIALGAWLSMRNGR